MMKQFLFEQLSNSVQNTTSKLITHSDDNKKIVTMLDNLIASFSSNQNLPASTMQLIEQDIEKISEFVSEILGALDSCLFTLEYNTNKYVNHLTKKKDGELQLNNQNTGNQGQYPMQNNPSLFNIQRNNLVPQQHMNNLNQIPNSHNYMYNQGQGYDDQEGDEMDDDDGYHQNAHYQQMNNGFNGMDEEDDEGYDQDEEVYLDDEDYDGDDFPVGQMQGNRNNQQQHQQQKQIFFKQQPYHQIFNQNISQMMNSQQLSQQPGSSVSFVKIEDSMINITPQQLTLSHQQPIVLNQNGNNNTINASNNQQPKTKTKTKSNNLTVNDIFT